MKVVKLLMSLGLLLAGAFSSAALGQDDVSSSGTMNLTLEKAIEIALAEKVAADTGKMVLL